MAAIAQSETCDGAGCGQGVDQGLYQGEGQGAISDVTVANDTTGAGSDNEASVVVTDASNTDSNNVVDDITDASATATTGSNDNSKNTGDAGIQTGDAGISATQIKNTCSPITTAVKIRLFRSFCRVSSGSASTPIAANRLIGSSAEIIYLPCGAKSK